MLPLTAEDAGALFDLIRPIAKQPLIRDVMHDHKAIIVRIFDGNRKIYERKLAVR